MNVTDIYIEIFLTRIISKKDLLSLINKQGISFDKNFDLEEANQLDMGMVLINDLSNDKILPQILELQAASYPKIKTLKEIRKLIGKLDKNTSQDKDILFSLVEKMMNKH